MHVVFAVGSGEDDAAWTRVREDDALHCLQAWRIQMLDDFDKRRRVESFESPVTLEQRALCDLETLLSGWTRLIQAQASARPRERQRRDVHAEDALQAWLFDRQREETSLAAAEVGQRPRAALAYHLHHAAKPLLV